METMETGAMDQKPMNRPDGRKVLSISCKPELDEAVRKHCEALDIPIAVWVRDLIKKELSGKAVC